MRIELDFDVPAGTTRQGHPVAGTTFLGTYEEAP